MQAPLSPAPSGSPMTVAGQRAYVYNSLRLLSINHYKSLVIRFCLRWLVQLYWRPVDIQEPTLSGSLSEPGAYLFVIGR